MRSVFGLRTTRTVVANNVSTEYYRQATKELLIEIVLASHNKSDKMAASLLSGRKALRELMERFGEKHAARLVREALSDRA